jgi:hypothetical protein
MITTLMTLEVSFTIVIFYSGGHWSPPPYLFHLFLVKNVKLFCTPQNWTGFLQKCLEVFFHANKINHPVAQLAEHPTVKGLNKGVTGTHRKKSLGRKSIT